jgi:hypothetical protein
VRYPLENLDDEKFQHLCQALLAKANPGVQCFPVGQPDGGRDAISRDLASNSGKFLVYQVKYVREPARITDPRKWLLETIGDEVDKVRALVDRSAAGYFLLTNVSGSAHLDVGSIDKMNVLLQEQLKMPSICWWRDDIERRLDDAWSIKWAYPEVMSGPDFLRAIVESGVKNDVQRRESTVRAFLRDQFARDAEVRFRQVDLHNRLLDLFVDVPVGPGRGLRIAERAEFFSVCRDALLAGDELDQGERNLLELDFDAVPYDLEQGLVGAASFLLHASPQGAFKNVVLEGAPGQGKSTISQYVCQVHRCRLLNETGELERIPRDHRSLPIRLPFRIDLRDFAAWMTGENPFTRGDRTKFPVPWQGQLEPFLAALVSHHAGGHQFSVEDLVAVFKVSAVALLFDGLDEVAEATSRKSVVDELIAGMQRLNQNSASLQFVVTSRPAAFVNSPGMPENKFTYLNLRSLTQKQISKYFENWSRARNVPAEVKNELESFISAKLDQPHIRELARNPMQLAILLSLIYTKGAALPEKRTALYDSYIEHFFAREAEKTPSVRAHRDLLLELHKYLGWMMHTDSERDGGRGRLSIGHLLSLLESYLAREGRDPNLARQLFEGMERVVVLVSRTEGTIEFEVQPVREYFAARYLFETAPLSTPGREAEGSRPDRFEVIARNSFWLNVTRFYAGCYSKGEISSLVQSLRDLTSDAKIGLTNHPTDLAVALLSDWVFAQIPRAVEEVVQLVMDDDGLCRLLSRGRDHRHDSNVENLVLAEQCGCPQMVDRCMSLLSSAKGDFQSSLLDVLRANSLTTSIVSRSWLGQVRTKSEEEFEKWLYFGRAAGAIAQVSVEELKSLPVKPDWRHVWEIYYAGRFDFLESQKEYFDLASRMVLDAELGWVSYKPVTTPLTFLAWALHTESYYFATRSRQPTALLHAFPGLSQDSESALQGQVEGGSPKLSSFATELKKQLALPIREWATSLDPWRGVVNTVTKEWGETRSLWMLAVVSANVKIKSRKNPSFANLFDSTKSLCDRCRFARLAAHDVSYWNAQFEAANSSEKAALLSLVFVAWSPSSVMIRLLEPLQSALDSLSEGDWRWLHRKVERIRNMCGGKSNDGGILVDLLPSQLNKRVAYVLGQIGDGALRGQIVARYFSSDDEHSPFVYSWRLAAACRGDTSAAGEKQLDLERIASAYQFGASTLGLELPRQKGRPRIRLLTQAQRLYVLSSPRSFPSLIVGLAERGLRASVSRNSPTVTDAAAKNRWFSEVR